MDLPLALSALLLLLAVFLAPTALLFLAFHFHPHHPREPRPTPSSEPPAANLDPPAPPEEEEEKRPRRRAKRKRKQQQQQQQQQKGGDAAADEAMLLLPRRPQFPLASVAGPLQRRITARYDDLARASQDQCLTVQIREFLHCLVDARNELLQKSEIARRSFTIKKALLSNSRNCRSLYDQLRLSKQVDKLESEHERLKKDAAVYNYLQEQLRMSDHYKLMMELNDAMEKKALEQALADEESEMSFEELLEEEKKDAAFWWRDGKLRSISDCK